MKDCITNRIATEDKTMIKWNKLRDKAHANAVRHGFWDNTPSDQHFLCLVISELMEAVEADRKSRRADTNAFLGKMEARKTLEYPADTDIYRSYQPKRIFEDYIKDTVEDELADAAIRLLDLAGAHNMNLNGLCLLNVVTLHKTFTENIFAIVKDLVDYRYSLEEQVNYALCQILALSGIMRFNLEWHIEQKMLYNESREVKHGKKY